MAEELQPCPFCGHAVTEETICHKNVDDSSKWGAVYCPECGATAGEVRTGYLDWPAWKNSALQEWNTRAPQKAGS